MYCWFIKIKIKINYYLKIISFAPGLLMPFFERAIIFLRSSSVGLTESEKFD